MVRVVVRALPCGDRALLLEVDALPEVLALADAVRAAAPPGVLDVVPAARTVLLVTAPGTDLSMLRRRVLSLHIDPGAAPADGGTVEIPVVYDGPDLDEVAALTGLTVEELIAAHVDRPWRVAFGGFVPGFAYLTGGDPRLEVPRRDEPRTAVPAGSVGLAGEFSGVYPRASPGGWQLLGRTDTELWTPERGAVLTPGSRVRFVRADRTSSPGRGAGDHHADREGATTVERYVTAAQRPSDHRDVPLDCAADESARAGHGAAPGRGLEVVAGGALALVQDLGRVGLGATGVGRGGAADRGALRLANRIVANPEGAAAIEVVFGGLAVRARAGAPLTLAFAGAAAPADVDGTPVGHHALLTLRPGQVLRLGTPPTGLRTYLAVRGGVDVAEVLGSRSTDGLAGIGPAPLEPGDVVAVGPEPSELPLVDLAPVAAPTGDTVTLRAVAGPRADLLVDPAALTRPTWTASSRSDRVGMRLDGPPLERADAAELPPEGMVRGAVQVPPGGQPVLFLADHPVTGGYPVAAVVLDDDVDRAAQVRPGQGVRFTLVAAP